MYYFWPLPRIADGTFDGEIFEQIFTPEFYGQLAEILRIEINEYNIRTLREGLHTAYFSYFQGMLERGCFKSEKEENQKFTTIAQKSEQLMYALTDLFEFGQTHRKLRFEIENNPTELNGADGLTLKQLLVPEPTGNPFLQVIEFLSDLNISALRARNMKPPAQTTQEQLGALLESEEPISLEAIEEILVNSDTSLENDTTENLERWKKRSANHKLQKNHELNCFVESFERIWASMTGRPFSEGGHDNIIHEPVHDSLEAIKLCMGQAGTPYTRQQIATAIRYNREHRSKRFREKREANMTESHEAQE